MEPLLAERQEQSGWWLWAMGKPELLSAVSQQPLALAWWQAVEPWY